jgi:hypothetical protein
MHILRLLVVWAGVSIGLPGLVCAKEIWIAPEKLAPGKAIGSWAVTTDGDTHFSFGGPEDMTAFQKAKVVQIGLKKGDITYDLKLDEAAKGFILSAENGLDRAFRLTPAFSDDIEQGLSYRKY